MRSMKNLAIIFALALPLGTTAVLASPRGEGMGQGPHSQPMMRLFKQLDLNSEQRDHIRQLVSEWRQQVPRPEKAQRDAHFDTWRTIIQTQPFDEAKARELMEVQSEARITHRIEAARLQNQIYQLLTPAQQTKYEQLIQQGPKRGRQ